MTNPIDYYTRLYDRTASEHGATQKAVLEPRQSDTDTRFKVMSDLWARESAGVSLLDLGCGYGAFLDYLMTQPNFANLHYRGIDISSKMIEIARARHKDAHFEKRDIASDPLPERSVDYTVLKGVLTARFDITQPEMVDFAQTLLAAAFKTCRKGMAFNCQNHHVPQRPDLFHWPFDEAAHFISRHCSGRYLFRADYGLYDYTAYIYRED